jgi:hypothetical protein
LILHIVFEHQAAFEPEGFENSADFDWGFVTDPEVSCVLFEAVRLKQGGHTRERNEVYLSVCVPVLPRDDREDRSFPTLVLAFESGE